MLDIIIYSVIVGSTAVGVLGITLAIGLALNEVWDELLSEPEE